MVEAPSHAPTATPDLMARGEVDASTSAFHGNVAWYCAGGLLLAGWLVLWNHLRVDWSTNEQYGYGWFVPPLAMALFALRWPDRPAPAVPRRAAGMEAALCGGLILLLLPLRLVEQPNPDWRMVFWAHAFLLVALSLAALAWAGGRPWRWHFAFPVGFLLLAVPWPSQPEQWIVQSLMRAVAAISAEGMNVLGVPAVASGNLIHVRDQIVGVSEACSGIRSLQATLMAGLLFGELSRFSWPRRLALIGAGLFVAMAANVFRAGLLVWIAACRGTAALEQFHDFAGFSVLLIVFAGLLAINWWLGLRARQPLPMPPVCPAPLPLRRIAPGYLALAATWLVAVELGTAAWYGLYAPPPDAVLRWTVQPPTGAPGFERLRLDRQTTQILRYDQGLAAHWTRPELPGAGCTLYFFRWEAGNASTTQAEMHQPHICLTASGMTQVADWGTEPFTLPGGLRLPVRRYEFTLHGRRIFVFFVAWQDRAGPQSLAQEAGSRWDRLRAVAEHRANLGRQTLELIATGASTPEAANAWFGREIGPLVRTFGSEERSSP